MIPAARRTAGRSTDRRRSGPAAPGEDGFLLLESIVALSLISIILAALGGFALNTIKDTNQLRGEMGAVQIATSTTQLVDSLSPSDLVSGRDATSVASQFSAASATVSPYLAAMTQASDASAASGSGSSAALPTSATSTTLSNVTYATNTYVGTCVLASSATACSSQASSGVTYIRVVVAVTWGNTGCQGNTCTYVTSTLVNADSDPTFSSTYTPTSTPTVSNPGSQVSTITGTASLQMSVSSGGSGTLTWSISSGSLPAGLSMSSAGLISGTATTLTSATSVTVTVTDVYGRTGSATFTWAVVAKPTVTTPGTQSTVVNGSASLSIASTCPNTACTFSVANAPTGLSINSSTGVISGTPTTACTWANVVVTVTDANNVTASTAAFTWKIASKPTISDPGTLTFTVGQTPAVAFTYTCPTTTCTVALSNTVTGLGLATAASTANNTTTSLSVSNSGTTFYVTGKVQSTAVSGSSKAYAPSLTITDTSSNVTTSATGSWTAYAAPTMGTLAARSSTVNTTPNVGLAWTCPISSCTISLAGTVPGVGLSTTGGVTTANSTTSVTVTGTSGTIYYTGLISSSATTSGTNTTYTPAITITDTDTVTASTSASWVVTSGPTLTNPGTQVVETNQTWTQQMSAVCPNTCTSWSASYAVPPSTTYYGLAISNTGKITVTNTPTGTYTIKVVVTDSQGLTDTVSFTLKVVSAISVTIGNQSSSKPSSGTTTVTLDSTQYVTPSGSYTYTLTGAPSWLTIDPNTGLMAATITSSSVTDTSITLTVTSTSSSTSTASKTFSWTLS